MDILLENVSKSFATTTVINKVNLKLISGNVYGFSGINGSGKTMLMRLIAGLVYPTNGKVYINGEQLGSKNNFPESMGLLIENPSFLGNYSGYKNLELLAFIKNKILPDDIKKAMIIVGLDPDNKKKYRKYSLGMKQRLGIACAIMEKPDLLILDEPLNSLDEEGIEVVRNIIEREKKRGACIILSCHDADELKAMSNEIYKIIAGTISKHFIKDENGNFHEAET